MANKIPLDMLLHLTASAKTASDPSPHLLHGEAATFRHLSLLSPWFDPSSKAVYGRGLSSGVPLDIWSDGTEHGKDCMCETAFGRHSESTQRVAEFCDNLLP